MRYRPDHKEETHRRIVSVAAREFREKGFDGVGIANLMKRLKLTHGGFYAHFETKDELVKAGISEAFDEVEEMVEGIIAEHGLAGVIQTYLSPEHVANPGLGCPVPSLASEVTRQRHDATEVFAERLQHRIEMFARELPGESPEEKLELSTFIFSSMVGAVALARLPLLPSDRQRILEATKAQLLALL